MGHKIFEKVPIQVPNKSGFDISHYHLASLKCGQLVPVFTKLMLPNDKISVGISSRANLPPLATDFYGELQLRYEAFFVPLRTVFGGWQSVFTHGEDSSYPNDEQPTKRLPRVLYNANSTGTTEWNASAAEIGPTTLSDYLGIKIDRDAWNENGFFNILPHLCYHKIWDDWYRNSLIQRSCFQRPSIVFGQSNTLQAYRAGNLPYVSPVHGDGPQSDMYYGKMLADGVSVLSTRQRNWDNDYFTTATTSPQAGDEIKVEVDADSTFSVMSLFSANALQKWLIRNNYAGGRYQDQIFARFGCMPSDAVTNRALYLGQHTDNIYSRSVFKQSSEAAAGSQNPFDSVGAKYGSASSFGDGSIIDEFEANEHGYIMIIASIVPQRNYASGTHRSFSYEYITDMPDSLLQQVGDQEIYNSELTGGSTGLGEASGTFAYAQRFAEHKFMFNQCSGLLRDGQSLQSFALQQSFDAATMPIMSTSFLEIPQSYLDDVAAVRGDISTYGAWLEIGFNAQLVSTLSPYTIATLGDPYDHHVELIDKHGRNLSR